MEMLWTLFSSKIFHHTHDTDHYSSNGNERPKVTTNRVDDWVGWRFGIYLLFLFVRLLVIQFSQHWHSEKNWKKNSSSFFLGEGGEALYSLWYLGLEVVNDIKRISEYIFNYLIYFNFVCYVPLTRSEREREREKMAIK